jgi:hypothetical protein
VLVVCTAVGHFLGTPRLKNLYGYPCDDTEVLPRRSDRGADVLTPILGSTMRLPIRYVYRPALSDVPSGYEGLIPSGNEAYRMQPNVTAYVTRIRL